MRLSSCLCSELLYYRKYYGLHASKKARCEAAVKTAYEMIRLYEKVEVACLESKINSAEPLKRIRLSHSHSEEKIISLESASDDLKLIFVNESSCFILVFCGEKKLEIT